MKVDKAKVTDEVWDDARVRSFLHREAPPNAQGDADYHVLLRAYQSMRPGDFARFLGMYAGDGRDLNARDSNGETLADYVATHRYGVEFAELLVAAGAKPPKSRSTTSE